MVRSRAVYFCLEDAMTDRISSVYKNGVLTITIPREEVAKSQTPAIKVPVK